MSTPVVTELPRALAPVTRDPFLDALEQPARRTARPRSTPEGE